MTRRETLIATFLVAFSSLVGIGIVEVGYHIYQVFNPPLYQEKRRIMFFDGPDTIFRNLDGIFTYIPHSNIFSHTIYFADSAYSTEYAYQYKTNNFGLVQEKDLARGSRSVLLLGDSFTEGQGAEPWFRQVAPRIERLNYQAINGGLLGTGFPQWWQLEHFLSANDIATMKLVVIFISDDATRTKWNFGQSALDCLRSISHCIGTEVFVRMPPASEFEHWVAKIRAARESYGVSINYRIGSALPATSAVYRFLLNVAKRTPQDAPGQIDQAKTVINKMVEKYGRQNVLFIQLPQKEELKGSVLPNGLLIRSDIQDAGGQFADGTSHCGLEESDFFLRDPHPNQQGYGKIAKCVAQMIEPFLLGVSSGSAP